MKDIIKQPLTEKYYSIKSDIELYHNYWCFVVVGGRNTGKTYGALKYMYENKQKFIFIKRTNDEVKLICSKGAKSGMKADISPFKSINRDLNTNIQAFPIDTGLGGFYPVDDDNNIAGDCIGYILSLNSGDKYKGSDFSDCEALIFDEFIPQPWVRCGRKEGDQLLDIYKTVARDRTLRDRPELKLICLANAVNIYNPTCAILDIVDDIAHMAAVSDKEQSTIMIDTDRKIFVRLLPVSPEMMTNEQTTGFYQAMHDTQWGSMAWDNSFSYNDLSCIGKVALKGYKPYLKLTYKKNKYFIYVNEEGSFYMCNSRTLANIPEYNLNIERDIRRFYFYECVDLIEATTEGRMMFKNYSMYDLIFNYKLRFKFS